MNLARFFHQIGLLRLNETIIQKWKANGDVDSLIYALRDERYDVRFVAVQALGQLKVKKAKPFLLKLLDDRVEKVSIASTEALRKIGISSKIEKDIEGVIHRWKEKAKQRGLNNQEEEYPQLEMPKWKKRNWRAILKQQLKKPMRWG